jgi:hypothetical protein
VVSWASRFADPIVLPEGKTLSTLGKAIAHLVKTVPAAERKMPTVLTAAELLTGAAEDGVPIEFARIATLQAINRNAERVFNPDHHCRVVSSMITWLVSGASELLHLQGSLRSTGTP